MKIAIYVLFTMIVATLMGSPPPNVGTPIFRSWDAADDFGPLVSGVELRFQSVAFEAGSIGTYMLRTRGGRWQMISGALEDINLFLGTAVEQKSASQLSGPRLVAMLIAIIAGSGNQIIDHEFVALYRRSGPADSAQKLAALVSGPFVVENSSWKAQVNVATREGGIECWLIVGHATPLRVESITRTAVQQKGWFVPLIQTGN